MASSRALGFAERERSVRSGGARLRIRNGSAVISNSMVRRRLEATRTHGATVALVAVRTALDELDAARAKRPLSMNAWDRKIASGSKTLGSKAPGSL